MFRSVFAISNPGLLWQERFDLPQLLGQWSLDSGASPQRVQGTVQRSSGNRSEQLNCGVVLQASPIPGTPWSAEEKLEAPKTETLKPWKAENPVSLEETVRCKMVQEAAMA